jgi:hypothetical protein
MCDRIVAIFSTIGAMCDSLSRSFFRTSQSLLKRRDLRQDRDNSVINVAKSNRLVANRREIATIHDEIATKQGLGFAVWVVFATFGENIATIRSKFGANRVCFATEERRYECEAFG